MHTQTEMMTEVLETPEWDDLLSDHDLERLRTAEAHHRTELLRGEPSSDTPLEDTGSTKRRETGQDSD